MSTTTGDRRFCSVRLGINDNGTVMGATNHHGDALHVGDFIRSRAGSRAVQPERVVPSWLDYMLAARCVYPRRTRPAAVDNGRAVAVDIYRRSAGAESLVFRGRRG